MQECKYLFFRENFLDKLDEVSKHLLVFNNGVYDLNAHIFREGYPEDYCSYCTNINYIPYDSNSASVKEVHKIFADMHKNQQICDYFLSSLALGLHGEKN